MTTWELTEKPRRKGRQFAVVIRRQGSLYSVSLEYFGKPPQGSLGYLQRDFTQTPSYAKKVGKAMLKDLKRGRLDRQIEEDLKAEQAWAKFR